MWVTPPTNSQRYRQRSRTAGVPSSVLPFWCSSDLGVLVLPDLGMSYLTLDPGKNNGDWNHCSLGPSSTPGSRLCASTLGRRRSVVTPFSRLVVRHTMCRHRRKEGGRLRGGSLAGNIGWD